MNCIEDKKTYIYEYSIKDLTEKSKMLKNGGILFIDFYIENQATETIEAKVEHDGDFFLLRIDGEIQESKKEFAEIIKSIERDLDYYFYTKFN